MRTKIRGEEQAVVLPSVMEEDHVRDHGRLQGLSWPSTDSGQAMKNKQSLGQHQDSGLFLHASPHVTAIRLGLRAPNTCPETYQGRKDDDGSTTEASLDGRPDKVAKT